MHTIENRQYHENSTIEEILALESRVYIHDLDERIIVFNEVIKPSIFTIDLLFNKVDKLSANKEHFGVLVNLTESGPPDACARKELKKRIYQFPNLAHCAMYKGNNILVNIGIKFIIYTNGSNGLFSVSRDEQEAIQNIKKALEKVEI